MRCWCVMSVVLLSSISVVVLGFGMVIVEVMKWLLVVVFVEVVKL